jgi:chemotaxis protein MotA
VDLLSLIGFALALVAIVGGAMLKGAGAHALVSSAAFMIVVLGTIAAICVQTPIAVMRRALRISAWVFRPPQLGPEALISRMVEWSNVARKQGLLGLEPMLEHERDGFLRNGLQMVVDGNEPETIRGILEVEMETRESADLQAARVWEGMGVYAPTLGIIGAMLGLMAVMQNLSDPSKLGHGIAAAFTATVYGIGLANLVLLPMANKLKVSIHARTQVQQMTIEGLIAIAQGENPRSIESRLRGYLQ